MLYLLLPLCSESFKNIPILSWLPVCLVFPLQQVNFITECDSLWHTFLLQLTAVALLLASWVCIWYFALHLLPLLRCRPFFGANNTDKDFILAILFLKSTPDKFRKIKHCLMSTGEQEHLRSAASIQRQLFCSLTSQDLQLLLLRSCFPLVPNSSSYTSIFWKCFDKLGAHANGGAPVGHLSHCSLPFLGQNWGGTCLLSKVFLSALHIKR